MKKPVLRIDPLKINRNPRRLRALGMAELLTFLVASDVFKVEYYSHPEPVRGNQKRMGTTLFLNGKKIFLDVWECHYPSYTKEILGSNYDLIIKLQCVDISPFKWARKSTRRNIMEEISIRQKTEFYSKVVPWTFFCSKLIEPLIYSSLPDSPIERIGFFGGKPWRSRQGILEKMESQGVEIYRSTIAENKKMDDEEYIRKMRTSKFGIVLLGHSGRLCEAKNRREIDYMILRRPLLLNYKPYYYDPLIPGKHYIYTDNNIDFKKIEEEYSESDLKRIEENAYKWYLENASPFGVVKSFIKIMTDRKII